MRSAPTVREIEDVTLLDVRDVSRFAGERFAPPASVIAAADEIVVQGVDDYLAASTGRTVAPLVTALRTKVEETRLAELQRAKAFYVETLGLDVEAEGDSDLELRCGQVTLDVFDPSSIGQPFAVSPAGLALRVADVDGGRAELEAKGVVFDGDTITTGVCKQAWFKDPDGNVLSISQF